MKVIDAFTFNNEFDILDIRLHEIADLCSHIVLVEGDCYQNGEPKSYLFDENKSKYTKWLDKIIHIKATNFPQFNPNNSFALDIYQRNQIQQGLVEIGIEEDTITLLSDVDEIPRREVLKSFLEQEIKGLVTVFQFDYRIYKYNLRGVNKIWNGTVAIKGKIPLEIPSHNLIKIRDRYDNPANNDNFLIKNAGNHLGYQSTPEEIYRKYHFAAEPFDKINGVPPWEIFKQVYQDRVKDGGSFIFCDNLARNDLKLELVEGTNDLPHLIKENPERFNII